MTSVNHASAPPLSPSDIITWIDENGRVATNLPDDCALCREYVVRDGKRVLVGQWIEKIATQSTGPSVDPSTGEILTHAVGRREPFRSGSTGASPRAGEPSDESDEER